jgi:hypothetical protein
MAAADWKTNAVRIFILTVPFPFVPPSNNRAFQAVYEVG